MGSKEKRRRRRYTTHVPFMINMGAMVLTVDSMNASLDGARLRLTSNHQFQPRQTITIVGGRAMQIHAEVIYQSGYYLGVRILGHSSTNSEVEFNRWMLRVAEAAKGQPQEDEEFSWHGG